MKDHSAAPSHVIASSATDKGMGMSERQVELANHLLLFTMISTAAAGCTVTEDPFDGEDFSEAVELRSDAGLPQSMTMSPAQLEAAANEADTFGAVRLVELARDYARRHEGIAADAVPLGVRYLRDLQGKITAISVTFGADDQLPSASALSQWITTKTQSAVQMLPNHVPIKEVGELLRPQDYVTVVLGATPAQPRLLSLRRGLPVQAFEQFGRWRVAQERGVPLTSVQVGPSFMEPQLTRGIHQGIVYQVTGQSPALFFAPSNAFATGVVANLPDFLVDRAQLLNQYQTDLAASLGEPVGLGRLALQERKHARQWGRHFALLDAHYGFKRALPCVNCSVLAEFELDQGVRDGMEVLIPGADEAECTCTAHYLDGSTASVPECDPMLPDSCCELEDGELPPGTDPADCLNYCECDCTDQEFSTIYYDHLLRGVPNFFQHEIPSQSIFCDANVAVGCGPIAAAMIMTWYDNLGHDALLDHHHNTDGAFLWQDLAEEFREDYLNGNCWNDVTFVTPNSMAGGMISYIHDAGLYGYVWHDEINRSSELDGWQTIKDEIEENRPLVLGYNVSASSIGGGLSIDHYAVITGHSTALGTHEIRVNQGWGIDSQETLEWDIPVGKVHLYAVEVTATPTGNLECAHDTPLDQLFAEDPELLDSSQDHWTYDGYPVVEDLSGSGAPDCDRIGGVISGEFDTNWTERRTCLTPFQHDLIDATFDEIQEEIFNGGPVDWIWP
jgi:hypothetical protein